MKFILSLLFFTTLLFAQTKPLIMKHADSLSVTKRSGYLLLKGHVHFVHDSVQFKTMKATWNRNSDIVQCEGNFLFTHPDGSIQAKSGIYQKRIEFAAASGNVIARDSAGSYAFFGERLQYDRQKKILIMPTKPLLHHYAENQKDSTKKDTLSIQAEWISYHQNEEYAEAFRNVVLTHNGMTVTCDTGYFNKKENWLSMKGNPKCVLENHELSGDSIFLKLSPDNKSLKSALVIRNAHGIQKEPPKKRKPGTHTEAFGDTLYAEFDGKKLSKLYVNLNAHGFFYEDDLPDYKNLMEGVRLDLSFQSGKMKKAVVTGNAKSTYFYVKKNRTVAGQNVAAGDTIHIDFSPEKNQVKQLKVRGAKNPSSGRYINLDKETAKATEKDSLLTTNNLKDSVQVRKEKGAK